MFRGCSSILDEKSMGIILDVFGFTLDFCLGGSYNKTRNTHILWLKREKTTKYSIYWKKMQRLRMHRRTGISGTLRVSGAFLFALKQDFA